MTKEPRIDVYRQSRDKLSPPHYVFSLTEDWSLQGRPVEWGILPIIERLKAIDLWNNGVTAEDVIQNYEEKAEKGKRHLRNNIEAFMSDFRRGFAKATDSVNTSLLPKTDLRRQGDKKYGSR